MDHLKQSLAPSLDSGQVTVESMPHRGIDGYTIPPPELLNEGYDPDVYPYTGPRSTYLHIADGPRPPPLDERPILAPYEQQDEEDMVMEYYDDNPLIVGNPFLDDPWEPHPFVRRRPRNAIETESALQANHPWDQSYEPRPMEDISVPPSPGDSYSASQHPSLVPEPLTPLSRKQRGSQRQRPDGPPPRPDSSTFRPITESERREWEMPGRDVAEFYSMPYDDVRSATPPRRSDSLSSRRHATGGGDERSPRRKSRKYPPKVSETRGRTKALAESGIPSRLLRRGSANEQRVSRKSSHRHRENGSRERSSEHHQHRHRKHDRDSHHKRPHSSHHDRHRDSRHDRHGEHQRGRAAEAQSLRSRKNRPPRQVSLDSGLSRWSFRREDGTHFFGVQQATRGAAAAAAASRGKRASISLGNTLTGWKDKWSASLKGCESEESFACVTARAIERGESVAGLFTPRQHR